MFAIIHHFTFIASDKVKPSVVRPMWQLFIEFWVLSFKRSV